MKIRTEAKIHVFFDKHIGLIWQTLSFSSLFLIILLLKFLANNPVIIMNNNILTSMVNLCIGLSLLLIPIFILLFSGNLPDIFDFFFANIKFKHDKILLCHLLLKKHHSSSKLNLELNKLKQAIENKSQLYNDLDKVDFPYINNFISRYYRYNNYKEKTHNNSKNIYNTDLDKLNISNPQLLLTMDNVDSELNNLINNQFNVVKFKNNEKQFNVINTTNKKGY